MGAPRATLPLRWVAGAQPAGGGRLRGGGTAREGWGVAAARAAAGAAVRRLDAGRQRGEEKSCRWRPGGCPAGRQR